MADRWAMRIARWIKRTAPHGHIVAMHNGPRLPAFAKRFAADPHAVDAIMYQEWGTRDREQGWLAAGIEEMIPAALAGWQGAAVFAEWGYERNPDFPLLVPGHEFCDVGHTRRGAWRGAMQGLGIIHGFENSWGPFMLLEEDQPGLAHLLHLRRFFTEIAPFYTLQPAPELVADADYARGARPLALATANRAQIVVYLPVGGSVQLNLRASQTYTAQFFHPVLGELTVVQASGDAIFSAPETAAARAGDLSGDPQGNPPDWVLLLNAH